MLSRNAAFANIRYLKAALAILLGSSLLGSGVCEAKSKVIRIDVLRGRSTLVSIDAPAASQLSIWTGPGSSAHAGAVDAADIADWKQGAVQAPSKGPIYDVVFLCDACEPAREGTWRCYGVRYAPGKGTAPGLIQIPAAGDADFPLNLQTIYRGVEGQWFRASPKWEEVVRGRIQGRLAAGKVAARH